jgi:hypothetical protein
MTAKQRTQNILLTNQYQMRCWAIDQELDSRRNRH